MKLKKVHINGVGEVRLERSKRARHICLSVKPFAGVRVAVPRGVSYWSAEKVARAKTRWLQKQIAKTESMERRAIELARSHPVDDREATTFLIDRLHALSRKHGYPFNRAFVRRQKTRWGSCSAKNNISLNLQLIRLPARLRDYVILHELVHTRIKNHGPSFWDQLYKLAGDAKKLDRELNQYPLVQPQRQKQERI